MIENDYFYHGSISSNITELKALSLLHDENKKTVYIPDIYSELIKYEASGEFRLLRFNKQPLEKQNELIDKSTDIIMKYDFIKNDELKQKFYKKYFLISWKRTASLCGKS